MTITQTQRQILPYQATMMTTTLPPSSVEQFASAFLMFPGDLELDAVFEDRGVSCTAIEDMLTLERAVYQQCSLE